ncbi:transcriptional regulator [Nocardia otitidiscaviarum]|uniref:transcriptional regulator n=1 Tax=Nocardia otitidiscaviarum TaxID=1823 RepID=UPI001C8F37EC|nr:transcriptional regulator [Nocardia otitidiscaviarum]MCP9620809.1 transcriptional regulator [Nocardia otitidiscaviarum]
MDLVRVGTPVGETAIAACAMEELNELFATVPRLKLVAFLDGCAEAEFLVIAEMCDLNKSTLSKAMTTLESAGYLDVTKGYVGVNPEPGWP